MCCFLRVERQDGWKLDQDRSTVGSVRAENIEKPGAARFGVVQFFCMGYPSADLGTEAEIFFYSLLPLLEGRRGVVDAVGAGVVAAINDSLD